jgi:hypothetical protein
MKTNHILAILAIVGGMTAAFTKHAERNSLYPDWKFSTERIDGKKTRIISASHLADLIYKKDPIIIIYDTREWNAYEHYHIPQALQYDASLGSKATARSIITVLYGDQEDGDLFDLAGELPGRVYILKGGMDAWNSLVLFPDFMSFSVRNGDQLEHILRRSGFFGGLPQNSQLLNIEIRESRYREGC